MPSRHNERLFVFTGGPGSGKTTLLDALAATGFTVMDEAGRGIIRQQQAIGADALPWADRTRFADLMLSWELRSHALALRQGGTVLFDRAIPDIVGYLDLSGLAVPPALARAAAEERRRRQLEEGEGPQRAALAKCIGGVVHVPDPVQQRKDLSCGTELLGGRGESARAVEVSGELSGVRKNLDDLLPQL